MLVAVTLIGILGVVPQSKATNGLLVFFSCIFSKSTSSSSDSLLMSNSCRFTVLGFYWVGIRWRNFFSATQALYCWFRRRHFVCRRCHHERLSTIHAERESMGE
jgi:hypothetical protein